MLLLIFFTCTTKNRNLCNMVYTRYHAKPQYGPTRGSAIDSIYSPDICSVLVVYNLHVHVYTIHVPSLYINTQYSAQSKQFHSFALDGREWRQTRLIGNLCSHRPHTIHHVSMGDRDMYLTAANYIYFHKCSFDTCIRDY